MLAILAFLSAMGLALRFNVVILVPAMLVGWILTLVGGFITAGPGGSNALQLALVALSLQLGYLAGIVSQWTLLAGGRRARSERSSMVPDGTF
jgi:hypothetical protein